MSKHDRAKKELRKGLRRKEKRKAIASLHPAEPSRQTWSSLDAIYELIEKGDLEEAHELLEAKDRQNPRRPEIIEELVFLYQATGDHLNLAIAADRLVRLRPFDADAWLMSGQGFMVIGRIGLALNAFRHARRHWPDHEHAEQAQAAIDLLEDAAEDAIHDLGFSDEESHLLVLHDEVLFRITTGAYEIAAAKAKELLAIKPTLVSARNNLTLALFHAGELAESVRVARETTRQFPENRFAEAVLGRTLFLAAETAEAAEVADRVAEHPADQQDAIAMQAEFLSLLGRDDDIFELLEHADAIPDKDPRCLAVLKHYEAVALARKGKRGEARRCWDECLQHDPDFAAALENLDDLDAGAGSHAPWAEPLQKWIPPRALEILRGYVIRSRGATATTIARALEKWPSLRAIVPALLDRGDPAGRELAFRLACTVASPDMLDALRDFAFSQRGPDQMRHEALGCVQENGGLGRGPFRMWCRGAWTDVQLVTARIYDEPTLHPDPEMTDSMQQGCDSMRRGDYAKAEHHFRRCVAIDANDPASVHNLAGSLLARGQYKVAVPMLASLLEKFPDYFFVRTTLAQLAIQDGDIPRAKELIAPLSKLEEMHVTEAIAQAVVSAEMALAEGLIDPAEQAVYMLEKLDKHDSRIPMIRKKIADAKARAGSSWIPKGLLGRLLPR